MSLHKRYGIFRDGKQAEMSKELFSICDKFTLDVPGDNDYRIEGQSVMDWSYKFIRTETGREVADVSKQLIALTVCII